MDEFMIESLKYIDMQAKLLVLFLLNSLRLWFKESFKTEALAKLWSANKFMTTALFYLWKKVWKIYNQCTWFFLFTGVLVVIFGSLKMKIEKNIFIIDN